MSRDSCHGGWHDSALFERPHLIRLFKPLQEEQPIIRIVAAIVLDQSGRVLLVRKRGTKAFMQPGGKLQAEEAPLEALGREMREELTCSFCPSDPVFLGTFTAVAANEEGFLVEAALYQVQINGQITPAAEIEEVLWLHPQPPHSITLAPLTREKVLPLALTLTGSERMEPLFRYLKFNRPVSTDIPRTD